MVIDSTTRMSSSSARRSRMAPRFPKVGRAPVILEFTSTTCRAGYAGDAQPRRQVILPLHNAVNTDTSNNNNTATDSLTEILATYHVAARLMQDVFDQLGQDPSERHCLIITQGLLSPLNHTDHVNRLQQVLWNLGVPAIRFLPSLQHVALALASPLPVSTSAAISGLVCLVTPSETHCVVFSSDAVLPFTYQVVPTTDTADIDNSINLDKIVTALLHCLQACPRDLRKGAASNLTFAGEICTQQPVLGRQIARQLKLVLSSQPAAAQQQASASEPDQEPESDPPESTTTVTASPKPIEYTAVPVATSQLRVLADLIAVVHLPFRPDLCTWIGVSLWAAAWHGRLSTGSTPVSTVSVNKTLTGSNTGIEEPPSEASVFAWTKRPE